jgi:hypothetical protein
MGDPFGGAGAAGGEEDHGRRPGVRRPLPACKRLAAEQRGEVVAPTTVDPGRLLVTGRQRFGVAVADHSKLQGGGKLARRDVRGALDMGEQHARAAHPQRAIDLAGRIAVIQGRRDQSRPETGEVVDDLEHEPSPGPVEHEVLVDPVRHQRRQPIAPLKPKPAIATGQRRARPIELPPADRALRRNDRPHPRQQRGRPPADHSAAPQGLQAGHPRAAFARSYASTLVLLTGTSSNPARQRGATPPKRPRWRRHRGHEPLPLRRGCATRG